MKNVLIIGGGELGRAAARALIDGMAFKATVDVPINGTYPQWMTADMEMSDDDYVPRHITCHNWRQCRKMNQRDKAWEIYTWFITAYKNSPTPELKRKVVKEFKRNIRRNGSRNFPTNRIHEYIVAALE